MAWDFGEGHAPTGCESVAEGLALRASRPWLALRHGRAGGKVRGTMPSRRTRGETALAFANIGIGAIGLFGSVNMLVAGIAGLASSPIHTTALPGGRLIVTLGLLRIFSSLSLVMAGIGLLIGATWGRRLTGFAAVSWIAINVFELLALEHQDVVITLVVGSLPAIALLAAVRATGRRTNEDGGSK